MIIKSTNSIKQENDFISLVDRVLKLLENPDVGNNFRNFYVNADANMDLDDANLDDVNPVDFTNHTFQTLSGHTVLEDFGKKIPGSLEGKTIGEKQTEIADILEVLFNSSFIFWKKCKLKLSFRKKTLIYLATRVLELQSIMSLLLEMIVQLLQSLSQIKMMILYHPYYTCPKKGVRVVSIHLFKVHRRRNGI